MNEEKGTFKMILTMGVFLLVALLITFSSNEVDKAFLRGLGIGLIFTFRMINE